MGYPGIQKVLPDKWVVNISHSDLESNSKIVINTVAFLHTCVAHAKTFAHGYVQPAAWNIGRILHFSLYALFMRLAYHRTHHRYVDS